MPWWSWIVIWVVLLALTALLFVLLGIKLFRQFTKMMHELGTAADMLARLDSGADPAPAGREPVVLGIYEEPGDMKTRYDAGKAERREERRKRRVARRTAAHRPQNLRDLGL
ncbi:MULTISPECIES: hypothetical protein [Arthrobacter]|uniref:Uncharacterized protein n=2 Tax=Arthrobacter TaxID=1663 RepID=A0ABU9KGE8_9MICC|nr:hypothetical protein [Arthrobacter sp. YJM1]MDP5225952.1 hypothetical protein [Arthrobacter sp. YJM1]